MGIMLILRGINNLLHEAPALAYAKAKGYTGEILDASGETGEYSVQVNLAVKRIQQGGITALYGFSGGGYNAAHIFDRLTPAHRAEIACVVILGAPGITKDRFPGVPDVTIYNNPEVAHMEQPDALLGEIDAHA